MNIFLSTALELGTLVVIDLSNGQGSLLFGGVESSDASQGDSLPMTVALPVNSSLRIFSPHKFDCFELVNPPELLVGPCLL